MTTELSKRLAEIDAEIKASSVAHRLEAKEWKDKIDVLLDERNTLTNAKTS